MLEAVDIDLHQIWLVQASPGPMHFTYKKIWSAIAN